MARVIRLREYVKAVIPSCDSVWLFDNSDSDRPFKRILSVESGRVSAHVEPTPSWATELTAGLHAS